MYICNQRYRVRKLEENYMINIYLKDYEQVIISNPNITKNIFCVYYKIT